MTEVVMEKNRLHIQDASGDTSHAWSSDNEAEVDIAKAAFNAAKEKGYTAYRVSEDGNRGEVMGEFDPEAERILLRQQMVGG